MRIRDRRGRRRSRRSAVVLVDHVVEVFIGGDRDEGIKVFVWELVLEGEGTVVEEGFGEARGEVVERGVAVDNDHPCVSADVAERLIVWAWNDVTAIAAHEAELGGSCGGGRERLIPGVGVAGARGGID